MRNITLEELLEAGAHFGHQVTRGNPKARDFIFEARDNIHIIDLAKTKEGLEEARSFIKSQAQKKGVLLVVGTKRQAQPIVEEAVKKAKENGATGIFYVTNRWIGGTLTNFSEVKKNFKKLHDLTNKLKSEEERAKYTKKEVGMWEKERVKLESFYGGIADLEAIPTTLFIIDTHLENLAVEEARRMKVATVGIVDTNADPDVIDYPIPANDDAVGSVQFISECILEAWIEGQKEEAPKEVQKETKEPEETKGKKAEKVDQKEEKPKKASKTKAAKSSKKTVELSPEKKEETTTEKPKKVSKSKKQNDLVE